MQITLDGVKKILNKLRQETGSWKSVAQKLNVSPQFISDVIKGRREPGEKMLRPIGFEKVVLYRKVK